MDFDLKLKSVLFFFGFQECKKINNLNFLKLTDEDYLLMRLYKGNTADLIHAKYDPDDNPCESEPYWEKTLLLGFSPDSDRQVIRDFINKFKD